MRIAMELCCHEKTDLLTPPSTPHVISAEDDSGAKHRGEEAVRDTDKKLPMVESVQTLADEEAVVRWLLNSDEAAVLIALARVAAARPETLRAASHSLDKSADVPLPAASDAALRTLADPQRESDGATASLQFSGKKRHMNRRRLELGGSKRLDRAMMPSKSRVARDVASAAPSVQFAAFTYFMNEEDGHIVLDVIRIGDLSKPSAVSFKTKDGTAKQNVTYKALSDRLNFAAGEAEKNIKIEILQNKHWETSLEFLVELSSKGIENAQLGEHDWRSRVKVVDNVCFPSDKYRAQILDEDGKHQNLRRQGSGASSWSSWSRQPSGRQISIDEIPKWALLWEYIRFNFGFPAVWQRSKKIIILDIFNNTVFLFELLLKTFLTDYVLLDSPDDGGIIPIPHRKSMRRLALIFVVLGQLLPMLFQHRLDYVKTLTFGVGGPSRLILQSGLFRKFLEVDVASRSHLRLGDVRTAMTRDAAHVVSDGFANLLNIYKELGNLVVMLIYAPLNCWFFGRNFYTINAMPLVFIVIFPMFMLAFLHWRSEITTRFLGKRHESFGRMNEIVEDVVGNFRLIASYNQRPQSGEDFAASVKAFNATSNDCDAVLHNNLWFAKWLSKICTAAWIFFGGSVVMNNPELLTLGMFIVNLDIFGKMGGCWISIYRTLLDMETAMPAISRITHFMNLPTDLNNRKNVAEHCRRQTLAYRAKHLADDHPPGTVLVDLLPIECGNLTFYYVSMPDRKLLNFTGNLKIEQGTFVCLTGPKGGGKSTLLKLMGNELYPSQMHLDEDDVSNSTKFLVPSHLRVLHIVDYTMFIPGTLWRNLVFGCPPDSAEASEERVKRICKRLRIPSEVMDFMNRDVPFGQVLSQTQCQLVTIARALIANPEVLCIHKPTLVFSAAAGRLVDAVLREFVDQRGFEVDPDTRSLRRPRTCIMTTTSSADIGLADAVFHVGFQRGIRTLKHFEDKVRPELLKAHLYEESSSGSASDC